MASRFITRVVSAGLAPCVFLSTGCGTTATSTTHSNASKVTASVTYADYPALSRPGPSGITVVSPAQASAVRATKSSPIWVAVKPTYPAAALPNIASAHEARRTGTLRVWVSKSTRSGLCILVFSPEFAENPATDHSVSATCGAKQNLAKGLVYLGRVSRGSQHLTFLVGAVPKGVAQVLVTSANGDVQSIPVYNNTYFTTTKTGIDNVSFVRAGERRQIQFQSGGQS
jgi:hypothetical protein